MDIEELLGQEPGTWYDEVRFHGMTECRTYTVVSNGYFGVVRWESCVVEGRYRYGWEVRPVVEDGMEPPPVLCSGGSNTLEYAKRAVMKRLAAITARTTPAAARRGH
jgi:hypothetical protein